MGLLITSRREGFRRAGVAHSAEGTYWPDGHFTEQQLEQLRREPQLLVVEGVQPPEELADVLEPKKEGSDESDDPSAAGTTPTPQGAAPAAAAPAVAPAAAKPVKARKAAGGKPKATQAPAKSKAAEPAKQPDESQGGTGEDADGAGQEGGSGE